jgi:hypothetical protein
MHLSYTEKNFMVDTVALQNSYDIADEVFMTNFILFSWMFDRSLYILSGMRA